VEVLREMTRRKSGKAVMYPVVFTSAIGIMEEWTAVGLQGVEVKGVPYAVAQTPQVWLDHQIIELGGELWYSWDVIEGLFPEGMVEEMMAAYTRLLEALTDSEDAWRQRRLQLAPADDLARFREINDTRWAVRELRLEDLVEASARKWPYKTAVVD